ncbi:MAG: DnaA regulatory inactivator Hda [Gammaproteobacteria bacterium]|nr:DnaA regulatory inactivator Hda [Gammaproteobacteria bacterium]MDH5630290.1 DnaA regulatory inactivator Hda [Gammaproteobacteria bacterium]
MYQLPLNIKLDSNATFENFVVGKNQQLFHRLQNLINGQDEFIYIWGSEGTGKTHLAQALCHLFDQNSKTLIYLPLNQAEITTDALEGLQFADCVCLDDVNSIEGNEQWEVALFNLYNNMKAEGRSLIVISSHSLTDSQFSLADLKSRLTAMEVYKLESLTDDDKLQLLIKRADSLGIELTNDVAKFVLLRQNRNINSLIDFIDEIDHLSMVNKRKVTIPFLKEHFDSL